MQTRRWRRLASAGIVASALALPHCSRGTDPAPATGAAFTPVLSVRELMEHLIDPAADGIFDAAVIDVSEKGIVETVPSTDEDWLTVERAAMYLAESSNLLKMKRQVAPAGQPAPPSSDGEPPPLLPPDAIQTLIDRDRAHWNERADALRVAALDSLAVARRKDVSELFRIGGEIYKACEACHVEYWYPGESEIRAQR